MSIENKKIMVIGGGIAGLTAAWELSRFNIDVELIEKAGFLGGNAIQFCCKATDECQQCGACSVEKMLKNVVDEPKIKVHLATEVEKIDRNGRFAVSLKKGTLKPEDMRGYSKNKPSISEAQEIEVDAIILASGFMPFNAEEKPTYGYGKFSNVITGMELERQIRENGTAVRPSDGKVPQKVAFIQCVGSRDNRLGNLWCSHVCCPYAMRMLELMKHKNPDTDATVFYMDIQNTDKNFPVFYEKCKSDMRFVRNIPVDIYPMENDRLRMRYMREEDGLPVDEEFDLVVLSIGIMPSPENNKLSELLDINLNEDGFFLTDNMNRTTTSKDGIFIAGTAEGPKTIVASMAHAGEAACEVMKYLGGAK